MLNILTVGEYILMEGGSLRPRGGCEQGEVSIGDELLGPKPGGHQEEVPWTGTGARRKSFVRNRH